MIDPPKEIDYALLDDTADASYIEIDGIVLASANQFAIDSHGCMVDENMQQRIHDTVGLVADLLLAYRDK